MKQDMPKKIKHQNYSVNKYIYTYILGNWEKTHF